MPRKLRSIAPDQGDHKTLDDALIRDTAALNPRDLEPLARPDIRNGCGPIGPTEQLPLVARLVNELGIKLHNAHFRGMDVPCVVMEVPAEAPCLIAAQKAIFLK